MTELSIAYRVLAAAALVAVLAVPAALALDPVNKNRAGVAIHGYDPVAYHDGAPAKGDPAVSHAWDGATWLFATAENRARFVADPAGWAPQYGGYCAKAVSEGHTADVDPLAWDVVEGRLYLNYSKKVQALWREDIPGRIRRADENWPTLRGR